MHIIVKKNPSHRGFHPHFNHALGKYYRTSKDYLNDMKSGGFEPHDPRNVKKVESPGYKPSQWSRDIINEFKNSGKIDASGRAMQSIMEKSGYKPGYHDKVFAQRKLNNMEGGYVE